MNLQRLLVLPGKKVSITGKATGMAFNIVTKWVRAEAGGFKFSNS